MFQELFFICKLLILVMFSVCSLYVDFGLYFFCLKRRNFSFIFVTFIQEI